MQHQINPTLEAGVRLPAATLMRKGSQGPEDVDLSPYLAGRRVVIVGLPGAFTSTCSGIHVPGFIKAAPELKTKGVDEIIIMAVNDPHVMQAWGAVTGGIDAGLSFLADPGGAFTRALGLDYDAPASGLYGRCARFAAIVQDGVIETLQLEEERGVCDLTSAATVLDLLG